MICPSCNRRIVPPPGALQFRCACQHVFDLRRRPQNQNVSGLVKCHGCRAVLRPPPGAMRFRCVCGLVLARPPTGVATARRPPSTRMRTRVQCPACSQLLELPHGHRRCRCVCGQVSTEPHRAYRPQVQVPHMMCRYINACTTKINANRLVQVLELQSRHIRCPCCSSMLQAPPGHLHFPPRFRCRCGAVLSPPRNNLRVIARGGSRRTGSNRTRMDGHESVANSGLPAPAARPVNRSDLNLDELDNIIAA